MLVLASLLQNASVPQAAVQDSTLYLIGEYFYIGLLGYLVFFLVLFLRPLLAYAYGGSFKDDVARLQSLLRKEVEEGADVSGEKLSNIKNDLDAIELKISTAESEAESAEADGRKEDAAELRDKRLPELEEEFERLVEKLRIEEETSKRSATEKLEALAPLNQDFEHSFVNEAVKQVRAHFPRGAYQRFEIDLLPSYGDYLDRVSVARSMAGVFVLLGLLGTMIKLDGVVGLISVLSGTNEMEGGEFLERMGQMMHGIGGAFENSIYGVVLMVVALIIISIINRLVQQRLTTLELMMSQEIVPMLVQLHDRYMPDLTLADMLRGAEKHLGKLNATVETLNERMLGSLSDLDNHIREMLGQFGSFQKHYKNLNGLIKTLQASSAQLTSTGNGLTSASTSLTGAAKRLQNPIDGMNETLRKHLELQSQLKDADHVDNLLKEVKSALETSRQDGEARVDQIIKQNKEALDAYLEGRQKELQALKNQSDAVQKQLETIAAALQASGTEQLSRILNNLDATTNRLSSRLGASANAFETAALKLNELSGSPTFFHWLFNRAIPFVADKVRTLVGKVSIRNRRRGQQKSRAYQRSDLPPNSLEEQTTSSVETEDVVLENASKDSPST